MTAAALKHTEYLASVIGPRGSATADEKKAQVHLHAALTDLGCEAHWNEFHAPTSGWHQFALAQALLMLAVLIFGALGTGADRQTGALAAAALGIIVTISFILYLTRRDNPLTWFLPTAPGQNVWTVIPPAQPQAVKHRVVIMAHVDTHRLIPPAFVRRRRMLEGLTFLLVVTAVALVGLFIWGIFTPAALPRIIAVCLTPLLLGGLIFAVLPDRAEYVAGGITNAAAVGILLALVERLKQSPLAHTEVYAVATGSAAVGGCGAAEWLRSRRRHLPADAAFIVLDHLGGMPDRDRYLLNIGRRAGRTTDRRLLAAAAAVAQSHSELTTAGHIPLYLIPDLAICRNHGRQAVGLLSIDPQTGLPRNFCSAADDMSAVEPAALDWIENLLWELLEILDGERTS